MRQLRCHPSSGIGHGPLRARHRKGTWRPERCRYPIAMAISLPAYGGSGKRERLLARPNEVLRRRKEQEQRPATISLHSCREQHLSPLRETRRRIYLELETTNEGPWRSSHSRGTHHPLLNGNLRLEGHHPMFRLGRQGRRLIHCLDDLSAGLGLIDTETDHLFTAGQTFSQDAPPLCPADKIKQNLASTHQQ